MALESSAIVKVSGQNVVGVPSKKLTYPTKREKEHLPVLVGVFQDPSDVIRSLGQDPTVGLRRGFPQWTIVGVFFGVDARITFTNSSILAPAFVARFGGEHFCRDL